ncbi:MAG: LysM peptidoglycan-binding domain-containing protein [Dictyoglomus sp.]|nr:LysM peptidoglycan-binding domain-containing protein [Dictyoglomus sp.]MCX7942430.1 LysM peptidoglycan-binding domain-containing protein [Dictyoglomaceae bacterium]MDW8187693.1 LysM peptidoglycan-binding domain-containing protein [Dictyoglomus sp.]
MRRFLKEFVVYIISFVLIVFLANQLFLIEKIPQESKEETKSVEIRPAKEKVERINDSSKNILKDEKSKETYTQIIYEVKVGDTTIGIAQRYSIDWKELAKINNLKDPNKLYVGQKLIIPIKKD